MWGKYNFGNILIRSMKKLYDLYKLSENLKLLQDLNLKFSMVLFSYHYATFNGKLIHQ